MNKLRYEYDSPAIISYPILSGNTGRRKMRSSLIHMQKALAVPFRQSFIY